MIDLRKKRAAGFFLMIALAVLISMAHRRLRSAGGYRNRHGLSPRVSDARARVISIWCARTFAPGLPSAGNRPLEAEARVASLTDAEVSRIADRMMSFLPG